MLTLLEDMGIDDRYNRLGKYRCECGGEIVALKTRVKTLRIRSCGCLPKKVSSEGNRTHGLEKHPLYKCWIRMKTRCNNQKYDHYPNYGGRGVMVCDEWVNDFKAFYDWAINNGWGPDLQLDKDIKGNGMIYSPETCCFVTPMTNSNNKRNNRKINYIGVTKTLADWSRHLGIPESTLSNRFEKGLSIEDVFTQPIRKRTSKKLK